LAAGLNYAVFLAEIKFDFDAAISMAQRVFNESLSIYSGLEKEAHGKTTRIMVLLKNNVEVWTLEQKHLFKIRELEQQKEITQALMDRGVSQADVKLFYEDAELNDDYF